MPQQPTADGCVRRILTGREYDIAAYRVGQGIDGMSGPVGVTVSVDPHLAQVMTEARFKKIASRLG